MSAIKIEESLGIAPIEEEVKNLPTEIRNPEDENKSEERKNDEELVKTTLRKLITDSSDVFDDLIELARDSELPRSYEVIGTLMKNIADVADKLMEIHEPKQPKSKAGNASTVIEAQTNNNLYVTEDIMSMIKSARTNQIIDVSNSDKES